jgi:hypothetical protein
VKLSVFNEQMPVQVTQEIEKFCAEVAPGQTPVYVPVKPEVGAGINRCHVNVQRQVHAHGGQPVYGWIIWQSSVLLHAEFHCNWMTPAGDVIDITPKTDGETAILFLPDPARQWAGRLVPSRRQPRRNSPLLSRIVAVMEQADQIVARYTPNQPLSFLNVTRLRGLVAESRRLMQQTERLLSGGHRGQTPADRRARKRAERERRKQQRRRSGK